MTATLQLFDNDVPPFSGGDYVITVTQSATAIAPTIQAAAQPITLSAPQVALPDGEVVQCFPPPSATGPFGEVLASVLLTEPSLPWERAMPAPGCPWLALLVFAEGELTGGDPSTHATTATVAELQAITDAVVPPITVEADVPGTQPCSYIRVPTDVFTAVTPRVDELRWLAHVRQSALDDPEDPTGELAVVLANRFPTVTPGATTNAVAHLVSVEGLAPWLVDDPVFTRSGTADSSPVLDAVVLLSLARWTFGVVPDPAESFQGLTLDLLDAEYDAANGSHSPDNLALRLPLPPDFPTDAHDAGQVEAAARIRAGYVPLAYHARSGEDAMGWYRGPVTPGLVAPLDPPVPLATADAALVYDAAHGIFDVSLAAAWQAGRAAALADRSFGQALFAYRQQVQQVSDAILDRAARAHFPDGPAPDLHRARLTGAAVDAVADVLRRGVGSLPPRSAARADTGERGAEAAPADTAAPTGTAAPADSSPPGSGRPRRPLAPAHGAALATALATTLADPDVRAAVGDAVSDAMGPVADWLASLSLLEPLPFTCLVPDPRMLPLATPAADGSGPLPGAIRFGYVDPNWLDAAIAGALSLGVESSRQAQTTSLMDPALRAAVSAAVAARAGLAGPPTGRTSALLLRSDLVSGWPTLAVTPLAADGRTALPVLRSVRLAPGVLLVLVDGVPAKVRLAEPHTGLTLGVDEEGAAELRSLATPGAPGDPPVGSPLGVTVPVLGTSCLRAGSRVLDLSSADGLVGTLTSALSARGQPVGDFGPAALALQLVRAPQALTFDSSGSGNGGT